MHIEDQTAPIKREDISQTLASALGDVEPRQQMAEKLVGYLNEKRDSYNGVISSLVYMIGANDETLLESLKCKLQEYIATDPMRYGGKIFITRCLSRLTTERPEFVADFFARFLADEHREWEERIINHIEILRIKIIALKAINQVEQKSGVKMTSIPNDVIDATCDQAILEGDETTKIDTLYILLDTKQATKVSGDRELGIFRSVFEETLNFQVPALRQKFLAITNKLLKRLRDSIRVVQREKLRYSDCDRETVTKRYMDFLTWMIKFCLDNIYCNKYFGSFIITMTTLSYIIEHITLCNPNLPIAPLLESRRFYDSILSCLALDSFEDNKRMALKLLFALPHSDQKVYEQNLALFDRIAYELVSSVNPAHSLTCQYIFKLIIGIRQKHLKVKKNTLVYEHLDKLVSLVEAGVMETKQDFVSALKNNAIYPKLTCIRALLDEIDLKGLEDDRERWEKLVARLVTSCIESSEAVSSIVCNMNPETIGHLPMDLKPINASMLSANSDTQPEIPAGSLNTITSQHLLITGWKTIKECSLSMGAMCSVFWWPESEKSATTSATPILKPNQIEAIINFFEHYLRNLRHRGAFEQAYNGFIMMTKRIWLDAKFKNLLLSNLSRTMQDLKSEEGELSEEKVDYLKRHVTRRSAGLPFLVQAIAVSEHRHDSETLRTIMETLIAVSNCPKAEAYQKIHCLNILKALMNDFNLGEKVTPYIGQVLLITIDAFSSSNFSIRNCANMLMRALVDRTFGVSRLRDEVHKRNTMSYEKFFTDYPELHVRFKLYLEEGLKDRRSFASVHAVFIVLFRLRPSLSPSDDFKIAKIVKPYIEPLFQLALTCPDFKLRELAAKLFVQLEIHRLNEDYALAVKSAELDKHMGTCISEVDRNGWYGIDRNTFHGIACILKSWVELNAEIICPTRREQTFLHVNSFLRCGMRENTLSERLSNNIEFVTSWTIALDLAERYFMIRDEDPLTLEVILFMFNQFTLPRVDEATPEYLQFGGYNAQMVVAPMDENLIVRILSIGLTVIPRQDPERTKPVLRYVSDPLKTSYINFPHMLNMHAASTRLFRQSLGTSEDFVDRLMLNLDLDSTAAHMTPMDKLNQRSELDSEKELWIKYCRHPSIENAVRSQIPDEQLDVVFDLSRYKEYQGFEEFKLFQDLHNQTGEHIDLQEINSPCLIEYLALVLKSWSIYNLEARCIWAHRDETNSEKLELLLMLVERLPDCDLKCLVLLCTANYFKIELGQICALREGSSDLEKRLTLLLQFTETLEELADEQHDRMIRETCVEILNANLRTAIECTHSKSLKVNLLSALIKLLQDETHDIRQASTRVLSTLISLLPHDKEVAEEQSQRVAISRYRMANLVELICTRLLDPNRVEDVRILFTLIARIIFNHTRATVFDVNEERESLFDKTKPNIYADHVATIHETLDASEKFFFRRIPVNNKLDVDSIQLSQEVLEELSAPVIQGQVDQTIGDYSWRLKSAGASSKAGHVPFKNSNRHMLKQALMTVRDSLSYFDYRNMLTDTSFGYHELSIYKRLALVNLITQCTNYVDEDLCSEIRTQLESKITTFCATTILYKCYGLLTELEN